jgi:acyl dehydratase
MTSQVKVGETRERVVVEDLKRTQIVQYAGASGDFNPLHTDHEYAAGVAGYSGVFAHGMLTMGMTGRLLTEWFGRENLLRFGVRFKAQVWPGDTLTVTATVQDVQGSVAELSVSTVNQDGVEVVAGTATARLDG